MNEGPAAVQMDRVAGSSSSHVLEVLAVATRLGLTSFGGPVAHLGYFRNEYVVRRKWLDETTYADLVALCQFLPGPASSQVGIAIGITRAGLLGGLAAWLGFTLPSAIALVAFAVWGMARALAPDRARATIAILAAIGALLWPTGLGQVTIIAAAALVGLRLLPGTPAPATTPRQMPVGRRLGATALVAFFALLVALPIARQVVASHALALFDSFFRAGSLVFGGGHVVLPLLQAEVVPPGWVTGEQFVAGYGAAQAVPGPLFTFAAYLGAVMGPRPNGIAGAIVALVAIFLPSFLLIVGALPFWNALRVRPGFQAALRGINAAVVGLLMAALYQPVWTSAIRGPADVGLAFAAFGLLALWRAPAWLVVLFAAGGGALLSLVAR